MRKSDLLGASAIALLCAVPAFAQDAPPTTQAQGAPAATSAAPQVDRSATDTDDIIVTATKREQTLQDVPVSVAVTSDDTIKKAKIHDLIDLQASVPSLKVTQFQSAGQTNFTIRGFGNGNGNIGIESSVGVFIDGVYRSRSASSISDLPELERIEVLRGPQSTLFGKNVAAGAISIVTKRPQFTWGGTAEATAGNLGNIEARASITGPISETIAFRLFGSVNQREGFYTNRLTGGKVNGRDRQSLRADVLFEPSSNFSVRIIGDLNNINEVCCGAVTITNGPLTQLIGLPR
ncbi:MAG: TonB-dependent receptor, partial [Sphingomonas sp.]